MNELLQEFNRAGIRYLLIGGQAMRLAADIEFLLELRRLRKLA